jgi:protein-tyrosine-phosphatase
VDPAQPHPRHLGRHRPRRPNPPSRHDGGPPHGLRLDSARTADVADVVRRDDLVIAVCDNAHEHLTAQPRLHWSVPDPVPADTDTAFEAAYIDISGRIDRLAPALNAESRP